jgi:16S rRNA (cytosine967-C5)-methyltransferase
VKVSARDAALRALDALSLPEWPRHLLPGRPSDPADPRDKALARQITTGVVKNLLHLEWLAERLAGRSRHDIEPVVRKILAVALCQLRFLERIPARAVVHEAVEQTRRLGCPRAAGFVNAVLRKAAAGTLPPLPDPVHDPAGYALLGLSHPRGLFERLAALCGTQRALAICRQNNAEPPTLLRLFPGRSLTELDPALAARPHSRPGWFLLDDPTPALLADLAERGLAQVQDPTAGGAVDALDVRSGERVLDRCCGMGTKTLQLAARVGPTGEVLAVDRSEQRCVVLRRMLHRRQLTHVQVVCTDTLPVGLHGGKPPEPFTAVLVDAPCSNSGVLARRPEARYTQTEGRLRSLVELQDRILADTASWVACGGRLVYSTCSLWPQENRQRVDNFLRCHPRFTLVTDETTLPEGMDDPITWHDGGYWALLRRQ